MKNKFLFLPIALFSISYGIHGAVPSGPPIGMPPPNSMPPPNGTPPPNTIPPQGTSQSLIENTQNSSTNTVSDVMPSMVATQQGSTSTVSNECAQSSSTISNQLWIPPVINSRNFNLNLTSSTKQFISGNRTDTIGYNCNDFWGPTLIMKKGDNVTINVTNQLSEDTTTHWHGLHLPAEMDGGPMQVITPGSTWSPTFKVANNAATYWYHPHMHQKTKEQLSRGAGGLIIVKDSVEEALPIPRTYGVDDIPLVLTSRTFTKTSNAINMSSIYGDNMLTNGVINAKTTLPKQLIRLRLLNVEIERAYNLGFSDNRKFYVITSDGGLLNKPAPVTRLIMLPGERYEVLVDLSKETIGRSLTLQSFNGKQTFGFPGGEPSATGEFGSLLNNKTFDVLKIQVGAATSKPITKLPTILAKNVYFKSTDAQKTRKLAITDHGPGTPFSFDNSSYDMMTNNQQIKLNTTEKWTITNNRTFGHSFHIHDVQFTLISRSSGVIPDYEKGWKDTFFIRPNETVSFVARFADYASSDYPFMYHCHMANHEDAGLMGQFLVIP